jgi:hypothetical protein
LLDLIGILVARKSQSSGSAFATGGNSGGSVLKHNQQGSERDLNKNAPQTENN